MSAEDPRLEEPPAPAPPSPPVAPVAPAPSAAPAPAAATGRVGQLLIIGAVIFALAIGVFFLVGSGVLFSIGQQQAAFTVEDYAPPQRLVSASEHVLAHAQPDASSTTVVMFGAGAELDVNGRVSRGIGNDWYRISWNGQTAFVRQQDTAVGEGAPPPVAERAKPEPEEEKPVAEEPDEVDVVEFPPAPPANFDLSDVRWVRAPGARDFARHYPERALEQEQSGRVVLDCVASASGSLSCSIAEEDPRGWGFGAAAMSIARQARIEPTAADGSSVAGRHVRLPLSFRAG
jgi:TonB family protein